MNRVVPKNWKFIISYFFVIVIPNIPRGLIIHADHPFYHTFLLNLFYSSIYIHLHKTLPNPLFSLFEISIYQFNMVFDTTVWESAACCQSLFIEETF